MSSYDKCWLERIEGKLDKVIVTSIKTEQKLIDHIISHKNEVISTDRKFRNWTTIITILFTTVSIAVAVVAGR